MKKVLGICFVIGAILVFPITSRAAISISGLYDTGVDGTPAVLPAGSVDPHYTVDAGGGAASAIVTKDSPSLPSGSWVANSATSKWIGQDLAGSPASGATPATPMPIDYVTTFTMSGALDPGTVAEVTISGMWAVDDTVLDVLVNGVSMGVGRLSGWKTLEAFSFSFDSGILTSGSSNTITYKTNDIGTVAGLRIEDITSSIEVQIVPEPTSVLAWSLLTLLVGLGVWRRRK